MARQPRPTAREVESSRLVDVIAKPSRVDDVPPDFSRFSTGQKPVAIFLNHFFSGWPNKLEYSPDILDFESPTPRQIVAFSVTMALLVPAENRRRQLALESIALLMHGLFGWSQQRATKEINICAETWNEDGYQPNFWKDERGRVHLL